MSTLLNLGMTMIAQATPVAAPLAADSIWDYAVRGGPTMIAIGLCSLVALTVIVERAMVLRRGAVAPPDLPAQAQAAGDRARALDLCKRSASPLGSVLAAALQRQGESRESIERAVRGAGQRELVRLRARMRLLGALPQIATMLGLLGTIFGMIKTFQAVAASGQSLGKTEMLARGIFEAWTCTAAGLLVAIPTLVAYHVLMGRIDAAAADLDRVATEWIDRDVSPPHARATVAPPRREPVESLPSMAPVAAALEIGSS